MKGGFWGSGGGKEGGVVFFESVDHRETYPVIISVDQRAGIMICHHVLVSAYNEANEAKKNMHG